MENTSNSLLGEKMGGSPRSDRMEFPHNRSVERDCRERTRIAARGNRSTEGHHRCPSWFAEDRRTTTLARSLATVSGLPRCVMALCCFALRRADRLCAEIPESADREASRVAAYIDSTRSITSIFETVGAGCARRAPSFHAEFTKSDDSKIRQSPSEIERSFSSSNLEKARIGFPMSWCISHPQAIVMFRISSRPFRSAQVSPINIRTKVFAGNIFFRLALNVDAKRFAKKLPDRKSFSEIPDRCLALGRKVRLLRLGKAIEICAKFFHYLTLPVGNLCVNTCRTFTRGYC